MTSADRRSRRSGSGGSGKGFRRTIESSSSGLVPLEDQVREDLPGDPRAADAVPGVAEPVEEPAAAGRSEERASAASSSRWGRPSA